MCWRLRGVVRITKGYTMINQTGRLYYNDTHAEFPAFVALCLRQFIQRTARQPAAVYAVDCNGCNEVDGVPVEAGKVAPGHVMVV